MTRSIIAAALLIAASSLPAWTQDFHEGHHPPQASAPVDSQPVPAVPPTAPNMRAESPSAPSAPQGSAQGQMQGGMMMNCAMMQGVQPNQGMNCPMMQGMRPGMQGQMQLGKAPDSTAETPKPN